MPILVGFIMRGELVVAKEQDHGGGGPYNSAFPPGVCLPVGVACLSVWLERFPEAGSDSFLFPYHKVGMSGNSRLPVLSAWISTVQWVPGAKRGESPAKPLACATVHIICATHSSRTWLRIRA